MRKFFALIAVFVSAVSLVLVSSGSAEATTCPPTDAVWHNNAQFTGEPDNYLGQDYVLNNNQYNQQTSSQQTMFLETGASGPWGLCQVFQPSGHGVISYPNISVGSTGKLPGNAVNSYSSITSTFTMQDFNTGATGSWQWMYDIWVNDTAGNSDAIEVEIVNDYHRSWPPTGQTLVGSATVGGRSWVVYTATAGDGHTYYAFYPASQAWFTSSGFNDIDILGTLNWLHSNAILSLSDPLWVVSYGPEISNVNNGSGGTISGPKVTDFTFSSS